MVPTEFFFLHAAPLTLRGTNSKYNILVNPKNKGMWKVCIVFHNLFPYSGLVGDLFSKSSNRLPYCWGEEKLFTCTYDFVDTGMYIYYTFSQNTPLFNPFVIEIQTLLSQLPPSSDPDVSGKWGSGQRWNK